MANLPEEPGVRGQSGPRNRKSDGHSRTHQQLFAQNKYKIDAILDVKKQTVTVSQTITFLNNTEGSVKKIYLNNWANSYEGTESQLVKHLANQFNRSFYLYKE